MAQTMMEIVEELWGGGQREGQLTPFRGLGRLPTEDDLI